MILLYKSSLYHDVDSVKNIRGTFSVAAKNANAKNIQKTINTVLILLEVELILVVIKILVMVQEMVDRLSKSRHKYDIMQQKTEVKVSVQKV